MRFVIFAGGPYPPGTASQEARISLSDGLVALKTPPVLQLESDRSHASGDKLEGGGAAPSNRVARRLVIHLLKRVHQERARRGVRLGLTHCQVAPGAVR